MIKLLVTGTGRCGTVFMARFLTLCGIPCGHESIFDLAPRNIIEKRLRKEIPPTISKISDSKRWLKNLEDIQADSSYMAVPHLDMIDVPLIHVVRDPLLVISSFVKDFNYFKRLEYNEFNLNYENWIFEQIPHLNDIKDPIERCCEFYCQWNSKIEQYNNKYYFKRIEDPIDKDLFDFLGIPEIEINLPNNINSIRRRKEDITIDDIPNGEIKDKLLQMRSNYGYS